MNIFVIFLIVIIGILMLKIKISIYFKFDNFKTVVKIRGRFINFERNGPLKKGDKKYNLNKKITKFITKNILNKKELIKNLKYLEINKLNINVMVDLIFLMLTVFSVPVLASILEYIKILPFKNIKDFKYDIRPLYNQELKLFFEVKTTLKVRILDLFRWGMNSIIKNKPFYVDFI